jgi:hypothetical protein
MSNLKYYRLPDGGLISIEPICELLTTKTGLSITWPDGRWTDIPCAEDQVGWLRADIETHFGIKGFNDPVTMPSTPQKIEIQRSPCFLQRLLSRIKG